jgi:hypothetical protein
VSSHSWMDLGLGDGGGSVLQGLGGDIEARRSISLKSGVCWELADEYQPGSGAATYSQVNFFFLHRAQGFVGGCSVVKH